MHKDHELSDRLGSIGRDNLGSERISWLQKVKRLIITAKLPFFLFLLFQFGVFANYIIIILVFA